MTTSELPLLLTNAGLSAKEAEIYVFLLEKGPHKASSILANFNQFKKGNTYALLDKLVEKGLVLKKRTIFEPLPPSNALSLLEQRATQLQTSVSSFKAALPYLTSLYKLAVDKPTVRYFEGEEGITEVFGDIYSPKQEPVWGCVDLEKADKAFPSQIVKKLIPLRIKNEVRAKTLLAESPAAQKVTAQDAEQLRETALVSKDDYPLPAEIDVYEDKIAMLTFNQDQFIGLIIQNQDLATTLKSIFKLAHQAALHNQR